MTCTRAEQLDLASFVVDGDSPEWDDFRVHLHSCADCAEVVAGWRRLEDAVFAGGGAGAGAGHPDIDELEQLLDAPESLDDEVRQDLTEHVAACRSCADELAVFREFDFSAVAVEEGEKGRSGSIADALRGAFSRLRSRGAAAESRLAESLADTLADRILPRAEPALVFASTEGVGPARRDEESDRVVAVLELGEAEQPGSRIELRAGTSRIGRSREAEVRIGSPLLSRLEASIEEREGEFRITALHRRSELRINGELVREGPLRDGDAIDLCGVELRFRTAPE